jgi:hypothetical protein
VPATTAAAALLLSFVPGLLYLRRTEDLRRKRADSQLVQLVEFAAVGLATTGLTVAGLAIVADEWMADLVTDLSTEPLTGVELRHSAGLGAAVLLLSCVLAYALAAYHRAIEPSRYSPSVWFSTLGERPDAYIYVSLRLKDGRKLLGALVGSDTQQEPGARDVALGNPSLLLRDGSLATVGVDVIVVNEASFDVLEVVYDRHSTEGAATVEEVASSGTALARARVASPQARALLAAASYLAGLVGGVVATHNFAESAVVAVAAGVVVAWLVACELSAALRVSTDASPAGSFETRRPDVTSVLAGGSAGVIVFALMPVSSAAVAVVLGVALVGVPVAVVSLGRRVRRRPTPGLLRR